MALMGGSPVGRGFSTPWKKVFHSVEKFNGKFPRYGKLSTIFSTVWKKFFHSVENAVVRAIAGDGRRGLNLYLFYKTVSVGWEWELYLFYKTGTGVGPGHGARMCTCFIKQVQGHDSGMGMPGNGL
jgi:hypothetical protein